MLASYNREILQILEGETSVVTNLFSRILQDPRHENIMTLNVEQVQSKEFVNWSMKEVRIERIAEDNKGWLRQFLKTADGETYRMPENYDAMYALLRAAYKSALGGVS